MTDDAASRKSTLLRDIVVSGVIITGVIGLVVAVAAPFIVDWIRDGVQAQGAEAFWVPIGRTAHTFGLAAALVTLLVLIAISVVSKKWKDRIWRRPFKWLAGLRVSTLARR